MHSIINYLSHDSIKIIPKKNNLIYNKLLKIFKKSFILLYPSWSIIQIFFLFFNLKKMNCLYYVKYYAGSNL